MRKEKISILLILTIILTALPLNFSYASNIEIRAKFDKEAFNLDDYISGEFKVSSEGKSLEGEYLAFTVEDEKGLSIYSVGQEKLDKDGKTSFKFKMPYKTKDGVYYIRVASLGKHADFKFSLGNVEEKPGDKPEEKPEDKPVTPEDKPGEKPEDKPEEKIVFKDVEKNFWAYDAIYNLADKGLIRGYEDGTFRPLNKITRSEFSKIIAEFLPESLDAKANTFKDLNKNQWHYEHMNRAVNAGILKGYDDGSLKPQQEITRDEATVMIMRLLEYKNIELKNKDKKENFKDSKNIQDWAYDAILSLSGEGIIEGVGNGYFAPRRSINRAEVATILTRVLDSYKMK